MDQARLRWHVRGGRRVGAGAPRRTGRGKNKAVIFCPTDAEVALLSREMALTGETPQKVISRGLKLLEQP